MGHCEIELMLPLSATLIQLKRFADAEEKLTRSTSPSSGSANRDEVSSSWG